MNILITGGGGFLGQRVARALLARKEINEIVLFDIAEPAAGIQDARVRFVKGEVSDTQALAALVAPSRRSVEERAGQRLLLALFVCVRRAHHDKESVEARAIAPSFIDFFI